MSKTITSPVTSEFYEMPFRIEYRVRDSVTGGWKCTNADGSPMAFRTRDGARQHARYLKRWHLVRVKVTPRLSSEREVERRLVVTELCDMHAFYREGRLGEVLRRAINFLEGGKECFPHYRKKRGGEGA